MAIVQKLATNKWTAISLGVIGVTILGMYGISVAKKKNRDKKAIDFFTELEKILTPVGMESENIAFDLELPDKVQRQNPTRAISRLRSDTAKAVAMRIYDKFGRTIFGTETLFGLAWGDDENGIYSIFRNELASKTQIAEVAKAWYVERGSRLEMELRDRLDETEMRELMKIVNSKPTVTFK